MDNTLGQIFSEEAEPVQVEAAEVVETAQPEQVEEQESTGEQAASPAVTQEDPVEKHRKGLEAAALAERRRRQEIEQERDALRAELARFAAQPKQTEGAPDPSQYTDTTAYVRDLARYEARQELLAEQQRTAEADRQRKEREQVESFGQKANESVMRGEAKYQDFTAAINSGLAPFLNPALQRALVLSKDGHDVAYHLAKNPAEAARIASLDPLEMAMEIGELRTKVAAPAKPAIPQTLTQARDSRGQFKPNSYTGPTPLDDILTRR